MLPEISALLHDFRNRVRERLYDDRRISGHVVYFHDGTLFVEPFDLARLDVTGSSVPVTNGISAYPGGGGYGAGAGAAGSAQVAWTDTGTAVYLADPRLADEAPLQWMDRNGTLTALRAKPTIWIDPAISRDGRRLALDIDTGQTAIYVYDWPRDALTRLISDASSSSDQRPVPQTALPGIRVESSWPTMSRDRRRVMT
jgi:hypothetical protein